MTLSAPVVGAVIRGEIGFEGVLISDDLSMRALGGGLGDRVRRALAAGCDLVLHCNSDRGEMEDIRRRRGAADGCGQSAARPRRGVALGTGRVRPGRG